MLHIDGAQRPITILESVIRQTSVYAPARAGYVSVFWGDQIFIPTTDPARQPRAHVEILCQLSSFPSEQEWQTRGLQNYGLIAVDAAGNARQAEKISYGQAKKLLVDGVINADGGIGPSIGSFTMSALMTEALLAEFATELAQKQGKMDTDPHFWMPMALPLATYAEVMQAKGAKEPAAPPRAHSQNARDAARAAGRARRDGRGGGQLLVGLRAAHGLSWQLHAIAPR